MPMIDMFLLAFVVIVVVIGGGWFIMEARSEDEK